MPNRLIFFLLGFCILFPFGKEGLTRAAEKSPSDVFRLGFSSRVFADVDVRDAQVAMDLYAREVNRTLGIASAARATVFMDSTSLAEAIKNNEVDLVAMPAADFLRFQRDIPLEPTFVSANQVGEKQERCLIVRKDSGISRINHLKGKTMMIPSISKDEISSLWLDNLLDREGLPDSQKFLGAIKEVSKTSQGVMTVFFRQAEAALATRSVLETMTQLNPQIGETLYVSAKSKSFPGSVSCFRKGLDEKLKQVVIETALKLHENPSNKQIFVLTQTDRIILFRPDYLENLSELLRERQNSGRNSTKGR